MIHTLLGRQGGGKSIYAVACAYAEWTKGRTIYSNIWLNFPFKPIVLADIIDCKLYNGVVLIDEVHRLLPSRNSNSTTSRKIVDGFLSLSRKAKLDIYGMTQLEEKVDRRFRGETDIMYSCERKVYDPVTKTFEVVLHNKMLDKNIPVAIFVKFEDMINHTSGELRFLANDLYSLYDSEEIVKIVGL